MVYFIALSDLPSDAFSSMPGESLAAALVLVGQRHVTSAGCKIFPEGRLRNLHHYGLRDTHFCGVKDMS